MPTTLLKVTRRVALTSLTAAALVACSVAPVQPEHIARGDYAATAQYLSKLIQHEMRRADVTGLSVALVDDQKIVWSRGFGFADQSTGLAATEDTVYRVGSVSKLFAATAVMQLAEQGKLDIDQPLQTYLPEFSIKTRFPDAGPITPRNIMTHHSGLPGDRLNGMWTRHPESFTKLAATLKDDYTAYPPNFVSAYSNLGITLLGHAVQNVSGVDYAAHMQRALLQPMGMRNSAFALGPDASTKAYRAGVEAAELPLRDVPAGGLNSNVVDLSRFMQMVFADGRSNGQQIVKPQTLAEMLRPQNVGVALDLDARFGLGWMLGGRVEGAGEVAHHGGATVLHRAELALLPQHKLGVVVLSNSASASGVVQLVAREALKLALQAKTGIKQPDAPGPTEPGDTSAALDLDAYAGYYDTAFGFAKISQSGDHLVAEVRGRQTELIPIGEGRARLQYKLLGLLPLPIPELKNTVLSRANLSGHEVVIATTHNRRYLAGEKLRPVTLSERWTQRLGEYELLNGDDSPFLPKKIALALHDGFLMIEFDGFRAVTIAPISDTEALILGLGRGKQETIRMLTTDGAERLAYSGYLLKKKTGQ